MRAPPLVASSPVGAQDLFRVAWVPMTTPATPSDRPGGPRDNRGVATPRLLSARHEAHVAPGASWHFPPSPLGAATYNFPGRTAVNGSLTVVRRCQEAVDGAVAHGED